MKIGNRPQLGESAIVKKWYIGIEILKTPPSQYKIFRPYILIWAFKVIDPGEPGVYGGRRTIQKGGWRQWSCPIGIIFKIEKF